MQEKSYIPELGLKTGKFWQEVKSHAKKHDMDEILAYMFKMLELAKTKDGFKFTKKAIASHGKDIKFFPGVDDWFNRINAYAKKKNIIVEHYIISSGLKEMIEASKIAKYLKHVYASAYQYDNNDVACWPACAVNYTNKTQSLFRINKGIINSWDNSRINKFMKPEERPIPFSHMIYLGDGETDIPAMKMVKYQGGYSIAVYDPNKNGNADKPSAKQLSQKLLEEQRADYALPANYSEGKKLDKLIKNIIDKISSEAEITKLKT
jgi:2-hydroxy-3-keto-5-methylthiopentenyl-1-phosphate phosphatase